MARSASLKYLKMDQICFFINSLQIEFQKKSFMSYHIIDHNINTSGRLYHNIDHWLCLTHIDENNNYIIIRIIILIVIKGRARISSTNIILPKKLWNISWKCSKTIRKVTNLSWQKKVQFDSLKYRSIWFVSLNRKFVFIASLTY